MGKLPNASLLLFVAPHCHALMWVFHKIAVFHAVIPLKLLSRIKEQLPLVPCHKLPHKVKKGRSSLKPSG